MIEGKCGAGDPTGVFRGSVLCVRARAGNLTGGKWISLRPMAQGSRLKCSAQGGARRKRPRGGHGREWRKTTSPSSSTAVCKVEGPPRSKVGRLVQPKHGGKVRLRRVRPMKQQQECAPGCIRSRGSAAPSRTRPGAPSRTRPAAPSRARPAGPALATAVHKDHWCKFIASFPETGLDGGCSDRTTAAMCRRTHSTWLAKATSSRFQSIQCVSISFE